MTKKKLRQCNNIEVLLRVTESRYTERRLQINCFYMNHPNNNT